MIIWPYSLFHLFLKHFIVSLSLTVLGFPQVFREDYFFKRKPSGSRPSICRKNHGISKGEFRCRETETYFCRSSTDRGRLTGSGGRREKVWNVPGASKKVINGSIRTFMPQKIGRIQNQQTVSAVLASTNMEAACYHSMRSAQHYRQNKLLQYWCVSSKQVQDLQL